MLKFFRKIRQNLLSQGKIGKYFKYAIGEIILVVIGILIALQINNWNEFRKQKDELSKIHQRLILDIDNDLRDLNSALIFWKEKEPVFKKVLNDSISADLFDLGLTRLLTALPRTNLNKTGVQQLKELNVKDELSLRIVNTYDRMENIGVIRIEKVLGEQSKEMIDIFQDKYKWFPEYISKTIMKDNSSKELQNYFLTSMEYKNRVANSYNFVFNNYIPNLKFYISRLEKTRTDLKIIADHNFIEISKKELEQYQGSYKVTKGKIGTVGDIEVDDLFSVVAHDSFLRIFPSKQPRNFIDVFYKKNRLFSSEIDGIKAYFEFSINSSQVINGFKFEAKKLNQLIYTTKVNDSN